MSRLRVYGLVAAVVLGVPVMGAVAQRSVATESQPGRDAAMTAIVAETFARPVTVRLERVSLKQAVNAIAVNAGVRLQYREASLDAVRTPVTLDVVKQPLGEVLEQVFAGTGLRAVSSVRNVVTIRVAEEKALVAQGSITGRVTDAKTKQPLRGTKITLDGVDRAVTDEDGNYRLTGVNTGTHTVLVKLLGYSKEIRTVVVQDDATAHLDVVLESSANLLDQVVVTGTVIPTELKAVPNAITVITAKQIEERGITHIDQLFRGDVPGLFAQNVGTDAPLDEVTMFSRGATALSGSSAGTQLGATNPIKTYVDGVEMANPQYLNQIDPKSIERIEILTGPQASTIYGSNALNGVMQIFTKRGSSNVPQLTLNLLSGWVENNFSSARTPQHDHSAELDGLEGRLAYNAGGSWYYIGPWTPAKQTTRTSGFGATRLELSTPTGHVTADAALRRSITQNQQHGTTSQGTTGLQEEGWQVLSFLGTGVSAPTTAVLVGQTLGFTLGYAPTHWWSHELNVGQDASDSEVRYTAPGYSYVEDTTLQFTQAHVDRRSLCYTTTVKMAVASAAQATLTVGADRWQSVTSSLFVMPQALTGMLTSTSIFTQFSRQPDHNAGGFVQGQVGVMDRLFLTYGLRAEWNPNFGEAAQPNYTPRYGVAYTHDIGALTAKIRASYGRATRPPKSKAKVAVSAAERFGANSPVLSDYGNFNWYFANPNLAPEHQQGSEGGLELYLGTRGSLVITRYNQTVDDLIDEPKVDSARSLIPYPASGTEFFAGYDPDGYGYQYQYQYLNLGGIRNQGWELQGSVNTGPFTTKGTYSWTKSRSLGLSPKYQAYFVDYPQYRRGATFESVPEHIWAFGTTYVQSATTIGLNVTGTGQIRVVQNAFSLQNLSSRTRLLQNRQRMSSGYISYSNGYALTELSATRRVTSAVEGVLQVQNLLDRYRNDYWAIYPTMGRQSRIGLRVRL